MSTASQISPRQRIEQIDKRINIVRWELHLRVPLIDTLSAASWQAAWGAHPYLRAREDELFRQRGVAQQERDEANHKAWLSQQRSERAKARHALRRSKAA